MGEKLKKIGAKIVSDIWEQAKTFFSKKLLVTLGSGWLVFALAELGLKPDGTLYQLIMTGAGALAAAVLGSSYVKSQGAIDVVKEQAKAMQNPS
jgi:hypothetical protein